MNRCRAAVFEGTPGQFELRTFTRPVPAEGEVLVRVLGCTLCGSDLHTCEGRRQVPVPTVLGHEIVGRIEAFTEGTPPVDLAGRPLQVGDRVTWAIVANCGVCFFCRRGLPQKCLRGTKYGHEKIDAGRELLGGLGEYCLLVAGTRLVRLPESLPLEVACPANCATATIAAAMQAAGFPNGDSEWETEDAGLETVCVLGAGLLGLTACAMARARGAETVLCVEPNPQRRERALAFGATHAVAPETAAQLVGQLCNGFGVDLVLELSGVNQAFEVAWPLIRSGGRIVLVGSVFPAPATELNLEQVVRRNLSLHGIHNYGPDHLLSAVHFLEQHHTRFPFDQLVAGWYPLSQTARAFKAARDPGCIRMGVRPDRE